MVPRPVSGPLTGDAPFHRCRERLDLREAEIQELGAARRQHHVAGLQVTMDDVLAVRLVERVGNLAGDPEHLLQREGFPAQRLLEGVTLEVLHDEELHRAAAARGIGSLADVVESADVRV